MEKQKFYLIKDYLHCPLQLAPHQYFRIKAICFQRANNKTNSHSCSTDL